MQDEIYWVEEYPKHEVSLRLKAIASYEQWAHEAKM